MRVGILALQGDVSEHERALLRSGAQTFRIRRPADLAQVDGIVLPGGESTTIGLLLDESGLLPVLRDHVASGRPTWGTCAGVILLADSVVGGRSLIGGLDITVERNAFGRQVHSFEADLRLSALGPPPLRAVFIRAPVVVSAGPSVEVLARIDPGGIVAVRSGRVLGTVFHPELTDDSRLVELFLASF